MDEAEARVPFQVQPLADRWVWEKKPVVEITFLLGYNKQIDGARWGGGWGGGGGRGRMHAAGDYDATT